MHSELRFVFFITIMFISAFSCAQSTKVMNAPSYMEGRSNLPLRILEEIIKLKGGYKLGFPYDNVDKDPTVTKYLIDLEAGSLDVMWTLSNEEYEGKLQAVYYPLFKGMFGMRLAIVKSSEKDQFKYVGDINDLRKFVAGQGKAWADTPILVDNGIPVVPVHKYTNHFPMLEGDRFDFFPRAIHEPWEEVRRFSQYDLVVDEHILLRYKVAFYFFVRKNNDALYNYLSEGMEELIVSGKHKELFFNDEYVQAAMQQAHIKRRKVIDLDNPYLTAKTPVDREDLWFDPINDLN